MLAHILEAQGVPRLACGPMGVHSMFCEGRAATGGGACAQCETAVQDVRQPRVDEIPRRLLVAHKALIEGDPGGKALKGKNDSSMTYVELRVKCQRGAEDRKDMQRLLRRVDCVEDLEPRERERHAVLERTARDVTGPEGLADVCDLFWRSRAEGMFQQFGAPSLVVGSILEGIHRGSRTARAHGRRHSLAMKNVFLKILTHGGPKLHSFMSRLLKGPSLKTTQRDLSRIKEGSRELCLWEEARAVEVAGILRAWQLLDAPCILAEDGTALFPHADSVLRRVGEGEDAGHEVLLVGTVDGPLRFRTMEDVEGLRNRLRQVDRSTSVKEKKRGAAVLCDGGGDSDSDEGDETRESGPSDAEDGEDTRDAEPGASVPPPRLATLLHLYMLVPLVEGAPALPFAVWLQDGRKDTYNTSAVLRRWQQAGAWLRKAGVRILGHSGDGAAPFRSASLRYNWWEHVVAVTGSAPAGAGGPQAAGLEPHGDGRDGAQGDNDGHAAPAPHDGARCPLQGATTGSVGISSHLIQLTAAVVEGLPQIALPDWLHILWRLRRMLLDPNRLLVVFGLPAPASKLLLASVHTEAHARLDVLKPSDFDYRDKCNWASCMRLFDFERYVERVEGRADCGEGWRVERIREVSTVRDWARRDPSYRGLWLYMELCHRFAAVFLAKDTQPRQLLRECGWCLTILGYWHVSVQRLASERLGSFRSNFITAELHQDMVLALNSAALMVAAFSSDASLHGVKLTPSRWSTKYCEYAFQGLRCGVRNNNPRVYVLPALERMAAQRGMMREDFMSNGGTVFPMKNKRGQPESCAKLDETWHAAAPGYYPAAHEVPEYIDEGAEKAMELLREEMHPFGAQPFSLWDSLGPDPPHFTDLAQLKHLLRSSGKPSWEWHAVFPADTAPDAALSTGLAVGADVLDPVYDHESKDAHVEDIMDTALPDGLLDAKGEDSDPEDADTRKAGMAEEDPERADIRQAVQQYRRALKDKHEGKLDPYDRCHADLLYTMREAMDTAFAGRLRQAREAPPTAEADDIAEPDGSVVCSRRPSGEATQILGMVRDLARRVNERVKPKSNTRAGDRFLPPTVWSRGKWRSNRHILEAEDRVAVRYVDERGCHKVGYAWVERCDRTEGNTRTSCPAVHIDDPDGHVHITWFEEVSAADAAKYTSGGAATGEAAASNSSRGAPDQRLFRLPCQSQYGWKDSISTLSILGNVGLLAPGNQGNTSPFWALPAEEELAVEAELRKAIEAEAGRHGKGARGTTSGASRKGMGRERKTAGGNTQEEGSGAEEGARKRRKSARSGDAAQQPAGEGGRARRGGKAARGGGRRGRRS